MANPSTFLGKEQLRAIIHLAAEEIRLFLSFIYDPSKDSPYSSLKGSNGLSDDLKEAAKAYQQRPDEFSDEKMVEMGEGLTDALKNFIRIEIRRAEGVEGAAQVVAKGIEGDFRKIAVERIRQQKGFAPDEIALKFAGQSSIEFNVAGVNKALPFRYLEYRLDYVLETMGYTPGKTIDAHRSKTIIAADGDSTMFAGPTLSRMPTLQESPTKDALNAYLEMGGLFMIVSGNNLERTHVRIEEAIADELMHRFILVANGAASMAVYDTNGTLKEIEDYRQQALKYLKEANKRQTLDVIYIGNDGHPHGNDMDGFREVGFERSFLVEREDVALIDENLREHFIPGEEEACARLLSHINDAIKAKQQTPYFTKDIVARTVKEVGS